jgi:hypothetical protein
MNSAVLIFIFIDGSSRDLHDRPSDRRAYPCASRTKKQIEKIQTNESMAELPSWTWFIPNPC